MRVPSVARAIEFPSAFLWGAATSAYQIEGSPLADGAGMSIWHRFSHTPGRTAGGETGDIACDHYRRFAEDVSIMRDLGLNAYRFSIAWGRILPDGRGKVNAKGLDYYSRLIDALLANGIEPLVTLYHWDLPAALDDRGGWLNPDVPGWFADYASAVFRALGDRVRMWITLNEPWVVADAGYLHGVHAPGHANLFEAPLASRHLLLAHAEAVRAYRSEGTGRIGLVVNLTPIDPASQSPEDLDACDREDAYMNRQYLDPVFLGRWPERMREVFGEAWPDSSAQDLERIREPIDFLGINYYTRNVVRNDETAPPVRASVVGVPGRVYTETRWEVFPDGLTRILRWVTDTYGKVPLYITENGAAFLDPPAVGGNAIEDPLRTDYYRAHLRAAHQAMRSGVDLRGYFAWSLLDNYEWASGYKVRFGIVAVDYDTQRRAPKSSALFYRDVIRTRGGVLT